MDSLTVNLIVIILVLIDLTTILFFLLGMPGSAVPSEEALDQLSDEVMQDQLEEGMVFHANTQIKETEEFDQTDEPTWMFVLSLTVVCCLFIELTLRQIGQGNRFWKNRWNIFDTGVIWLSIIAIGIRRSVDAANTPGVHSVVVLRVISRVAIGLRVMRVLINLRRLRQLGRHMKTKLRSLVSQNKRYMHAREVAYGFVYLCACGCIDIVAFCTYVHARTHFHIRPKTCVVFCVCRAGASSSMASIWISRTLRIV